MLFACTTVMEVAIVGGIIREVLVSLGASAARQASRVLDAHNEIRRLHDHLGRIMSEIRDADQANCILHDHSEATNRSLKNLIDFAYEVESIIDRFNIEMDMRGSSLQVRHLQPFFFVSKYIALYLRETVYAERGSTDKAPSRPPTPRLIYIQHDKKKKSCQVLRSCLPRRLHPTPLAFLRPRPATDLHLAGVASELRHQ